METLNYTATEELTNLYIQNKAVYFEGCPPFMNDIRDKAIGIFSAKGIPSKKNENYKFTDLRPVFQNDYDVVPRYVFNEVKLHDMFRCDVPQLNAHVILMINGWYYNRNMMFENLPEGVICCGLQYAANNYPELVEKNYNKLSGTTDDPLTNLNTAYAKDGLFLYVPDNVTIEKPVQIINILNSKTNTLAIQRNMFIIGENSEAKIVFCDHTLNRNYYILNNLTECFVGKSARMGFYAIQNQHNAAANNNNLYISLSANSDLDTNFVTLNGGIVRNNINVSLDGEYANASVNGIAYADQNQHIDNFTFIDHVVPNCTSNQIFKNILDDKASGAFSGKIHVFPDAQKTEAFQRNNNVLLTENSTMNSKPQLIIDADDVKCSHGATIGRIDEEALFYLRTRGISEKEARLMIMFAFADEVISQIKVPALKERIEELVNRRLKGDLGPCQHCSLTCSH